MIFVRITLDVFEVDSVLSKIVRNFTFKLMAYLKKNYIIKSEIFISFEVTLQSRGTISSADICAQLKGLSFSSRQ